MDEKIQELVDKKINYTEDEKILFKKGIYAGVSLILQQKVNIRHGIRDNKISIKTILNK